MPETGSVDEIEDIGKVTISSSAPIGARLWTSKEITRNVKCSGVPNINENVYFYGNPDNAPLRPGVGMGVIYNGMDLGIVTTSTKVKTDIYVTGVKESRGTVRFQVYLQKTVAIGNPTPHNSIAVFQLDGVGGINQEPNSNYRYSAGGINRINLTDCSVQLIIPNEISFGNLYWRSKGDIVSSRNFTVRVEKSPECKSTDDAGVNLLFEPISGALENDNRHLNMNDGSILRIVESDTILKFREPLRFWDNISHGNSQERIYRAEIYSTGEPKVGDYSQSIIVRINYA